MAAPICLVALVIGLVSHASAQNLNALYDINNYVPPPPPPAGRSERTLGEENNWANLRYSSKESETLTENLLHFKRQVDAMPSNKRALNDAWTNIGPTSDGTFPGGRTRAFIVDPDNSKVLYAGGVAGGIWKYTGTAWVSLNDSMANLAISCLAYDRPNKIIYAGTGEGFYNSDARRGLGIFFSKNAGATWDSLGTTASGDNFAYVNKIAVSPNALYVATRAGIFWSQDGGTLFATQEGEFLWVAVTTQAGKDVAFAWEKGHGIWRSENLGSFVKTAGTDIPYSDSFSQDFWRGTIAVSPSNASIIYVTQASNVASQPIRQIWRSLDAGVTWKKQLNNTAINSVIFSNPIADYTNGTGYNCKGELITAPSTNQGWYANIIAVHPSNPDIVFVGGVDLFRSTDGGVNFSPISAWNLPFSDSHYLHSDQHNIVFSPDFSTDNTMYITNDGGIYKTTQAVSGAALTDVCSRTVTIQYTNLNNGYGTLQFYHGTAPSNGRYLLGGTQDNGSWRFQYGKWTQILDGNGGFTAVDMTNGKHYVSYININVYRFDSLTSRTLITGGIETATNGTGSFINPYVLDKNYPKIMYISNDRLWKTNDATASPVVWTAIGSTKIGFKPTAMAIDPTSTYLFIGDGTGDVLRASLGGPVTITTYSVCANCAISSITFHPLNSSIVFATVSTYGKPHLWVSPDSGKNWNPFSTGIPDIPAWTFFISPQDVSIMYLGTDSGVLYYDEVVKAWTPVTAYGLPNTPVQWFDYDPSCSTLFAFTHGRGIYSVVLTGPTPCEITKTCPCWLGNTRVESNTTLTVFKSDVGCNNTCFAGSVYCLNGTLTGDCSFIYTSCTNKTNCTCYDATGGPLESGKSRTVYSNRNTCFGPCVAGNITCNDGVLLGDTDFGYSYCTERTDCPCYDVPGGGKLYSGDSMTVYSHSYGTCSDTCSSNEGTVWCDNGKLYGDTDFYYSWCEDANSCPCETKFGTIQDGECKPVYTSNTGSCTTPCSSLAGTITCANGQLSGSTSYTYDTCSNPPSCGCEAAPGGSLGEGVTRPVYSSGTAPCGSTCSSISTTITCSGGKIIGGLGYNFASCSEATNCPCHSDLFGTIDNGNWKTVFKYASSCDGPCTPSTIKCNNGQLSGDTTCKYLTCSTDSCPCPGCTCYSAVGGPLASGATRPVFNVGSSCDGLCNAGHISCRDGVLSGDTSFKYSECTFESQCPCSSDCPCTTNFGKTIYSGDWLTVYPNSSSSCSSNGTIYCKNKVLTGQTDYTSTTCGAGGKDCYNDVYGSLSNGANLTVYSENFCGCDASCQDFQGVVTCNNGVFEGAITYPYTTCNADTACECTDAPGGTLKNGAQRTVFSYSSVDCGISCNDVAGIVKCESGKLTGSSFKYASCSSCPSTEQFSDEKVASASFITASAILIAILTLAIRLLH